MQLEQLPWQKSLRTSASHQALEATAAWQQQRSQHRRTELIPSLTTRASDPANLVTILAAAAMDQADSYGAGSGSTAGTAGSSQWLPPCSTCGFSKGHRSGICYFAEPHKADPDWPGPARGTDLKLVLTYLEACAGTPGAQPRVGRIRDEIHTLRRSGKLSPQVEQCLSGTVAAAGIRPAFQQQNFGAAAQLWAPPQTPVMTPAMAPYQPWTPVAASAPHYMQPSPGYHAAAAMVPSAVDTPVAVRQPPLRPASVLRCEEQSLPPAAAVVPIQPPGLQQMPPQGSFFAMAAQAGLVQEDEHEQCLDRGSGYACQQACTWT